MYSYLNQLFSILAPIFQLKSIIESSYTIMKYWGDIQLGLIVSLMTMEVVFIFILQYYCHSFNKVVIKCEDFRGSNLSK